jgi:hypothetical protein
VIGVVSRPSFVPTRPTLSLRCVSAIEERARAKIEWRCRGRVRRTEEWRESRLGLRGITEVKTNCGGMWGPILGRMLPSPGTPTPRARRVLNMTFL